VHSSVKTSKLITTSSVQNMIPDSVVIVSGGMDSVTLLHYLVIREGITPAVISFNYGQKHAKELKYAVENSILLNCPEHKVADLSPLNFLFGNSALVGESLSVPDIEEVKGNHQPSTYVPNRNMIFLALAAAYAENLGVDTVYYGAQAHDLYGYWDTTPSFVERLNKIYELNRNKAIRIQAPFVHYTKADVLRLGVELNVDYARTWSCYSGNDKACGRCPTCAERLNAFAQVGLTDPVEYDNQA
jgi:7-cyano-7-deazaguanine synthase